MEIPISVLAAYGITPDRFTWKPFGTGLINHTWMLACGEKEYILQRINHTVFKDPVAIAYNIEAIADYLKEHHPAYFFVSPILTTDDAQMVFAHGNDGGFFRIFPFVAGSHSKEVAVTADSAYEAARQFGRFTRLLSGFDTDTLHNTLPHFHDLGFRYEQFLQALQTGNRERIQEASALVHFIQANTDIVEQFIQIQKNPAFKERVTHHDTKISNVLFDSSDKAICVIDLDTVMPGYFISDVGDMMRTYLPTVSEEEADFGKIDVRDEMYFAIVKGYLEEMNEELSAEEKQSFFYAAKFMIYMQAIRFLADYFNDDVYYGAKYPAHNLVRAGNQVTLLKCLLEKETYLINKTL